MLLLLIIFIIAIFILLILMAPPDKAPEARHTCNSRSEIQSVSEGRYPANSLAHASGNYSRNLKLAVADLELGGFAE